MFAVFLAFFLYGVNLGWVAPVLKNSEEQSYEITLKSDERAWIASLHEPFKMCGMICCVLTIDILGRKTVLLATSVCYLLGWLLIRFTKLVIFVYFSRLFFGFMAGLTDSTTVICIGESSSSDLRGVFSSICVMTFFGGLLTEFVMATYLPYNAVATVNLCVGILQLSSMYMMKETVQYLVMKGRYEQAEHNYQWLFSGDKNEFENLKESVNASIKSSVSLKEFFTNPHFYKSVSIGILSTILIYSTGVWALFAYASIAFPSSDTLTANEFTICYGFVQFASSFGCSFFIERFNRRTILLTALAFGTLTHVTSATLYYVHEHFTPIPNFPWLIFVSITSFSIISSIGMLPISAALRSELFPQKIKPLGVGLASSAGSLGIFLTSIRFIQIAETFGMHVNFLIFSAMSIVTFVYVYLFVPETRGKSLHEIQRAFDKSETSDEGK